MAKAVTINDRIAQLKATYQAGNITERVFFSSYTSLLSRKHAAGNQSKPTKPKQKQEAPPLDL